MNQDQNNHIIEGLRPLAFPIAELTIDPRNARNHSKENISGIKTSLRLYGQRKPIVVNRQGNVIEAGNGTLQAAQELGWTHIAAVFVDDAPETAIGFSLADNRTAELAEWDKDVLEKLLLEFKFADEEMAEIVSQLAKDESLLLMVEGKKQEKDIAPILAGLEYRVVVDCADEHDQIEFINRTEKAGYKCRALIS